MNSFTRESGGVFIMQNQLHLQQKGHTMDHTYKVYFKHDGCSMLLFKGLTDSGAYARVRTLRNQFSGWCGKFIITK